MLPASFRPAILLASGLSLALASATPAMALGKNERNFLKGVAAAVIIHNLAKQNRPSHATPHHHHHHDPHPPRRVAPAPAPPPPHYGHGRHRPHGHGHVQPQAVVASAFQEYSPAARRAIQTRLRSYGYYSGPIDGIWGRGTALAIERYAGDARAAEQLRTRDGTVRLLNRLIA